MSFHLNAGRLERVTMVNCVAQNLPNNTNQQLIQIQFNWLTINNRNAPRKVRECQADSGQQYLAIVSTVLLIFQQFLN